MGLAESVTVVISGVLPPLGMAYCAMVLAPFRQAGVDVIFIGVDHAPLGDGLLDQRPDRHQLAVLEHSDHDLTSPLDRKRPVKATLGTARFERVPEGPSFGSDERPAQGSRHGGPADLLSPTSLRLASAGQSWKKPGRYGGRLLLLARFRAGLLRTT
jgi:hypothetical protein